MKNLQNLKIEGYTGGVKMYSAYYNYDYSYINHSNKHVCFNFESKKRVKMKVINFIKNHHQESDIIKFLKDYDLKLEVINSSKKYLMYEIKDIEVLK